jgi:hypothetical protein
VVNATTARCAALVALLAGCAAEPKHVAPPPEVAEPVRAAPAPDPDNEIQLQGELGTLEPSEIEEPFRKQGAPINACYAAAVEKFWYVGGALELKLRVLKDGAVKSVFVTRPLGNWDAERCVVAIASSMRLPAPRGNAEAEFSYSLQFRGRAPLRTWERGDVERVFDEHRARLDGCASKGNVPPGLRVTFFVAPGGIAKSVGVGADAALEEGYGRCVADEVGRWHFEDPRGRIARATYEFGQ